MGEQTSARKFGILSAQPDPVAQLLQDAFADRSLDFVQVADPPRDLAGVDEVLVTSQAFATAHAVDLIAARTPCTILVRRSGQIGERERWRAGVAWLAEIIRAADWDWANVVALTPDAAAELTEVMGREVGVLAQLRRIPGDRPLVNWPRDPGVIEFTDLADKSDPDAALDDDKASDDAAILRRAQTDIFSWVRLRRLARLAAADPEDLDMQDLAAYANGTLAADDAGEDAGITVVSASQSTPPCILVVVPNGVGLGHVTRMMAVGRALQDEGQARVIFWSFSRAAEILQTAGFEVILRQNAQHLSAHPPDWRQWETLEFANAIRHLKPSAVIYDGGTFDMFMINALRAPGCGRCGVVWVRRGMLHPDSDAKLLEAEQYCDIVLEPGDLSVDLDLGPTRTRRAQHQGFSRFSMADPVTLKPYLPSYGRREARKRLGLGMGKYCLISLGGEFGNWDILRQQIIEMARKARVKLIWAQSPLAAATGDDLGSAMVRQFYPLSRYMSAFDGMISAAGYNSYHEFMLGYDGPVLLAPTNFNRLDDQVARATHAKNQNWASVVFAEDPTDQSDVIADFMAQVRKGEKIETRPAPVQGAPHMAREILAVCAKYR